MRLYEGGGPGSCVQSRSTGRGVHCHGELKGVSPEAKGNRHARNEEIREGRSLKGLGVMAVKIETRRSSPGQGEAGRKPGGSLKGF